MARPLPLSCEPAADRNFLTYLQFGVWLPKRREPLKLRTRWNANSHPLLLAIRLAFQPTLIGEMSDVFRLARMDHQPR